MKFSIRLTNLLVLSIVILASAIGIVSCQHTPEDLSTYPKVCFDSKVLSIFKNSCAMAGCHTGGGEAGYDFRNYEGIMDAVVAGSPSKSAAYKSITAIWGETAMPPQQALSEENRTLIRLWIEQGADNSSCSDTTGGGGGDGGYYNSRACFQRDIYPVILSNCAMSGCHDGKSSNGEDEMFGLTKYSSILRIVVPKHPNSSSLFHVISGGGEESMPPAPNSPLASAQVDSIYNWILYGALNENCGDVCDTAATATFSGIVWPIIQNNCTGCHSGANAQKGQHLENYSDVSAIAKNGKLNGALKGLSGMALMPPGTALSYCKISLIEKWINEGSPNN